MSSRTEASKFKVLALVGLTGALLIGICTLLGYRLGLRVGSGSSTEVVIGEEPEGRPQKHDESQEVPPGTDSKKEETLHTSDREGTTLSQEHGRATSRTRNLQGESPSTGLLDGLRDLVRPGFPSKEALGLVRRIQGGNPEDLDRILSEIKDRLLKDGGKTEIDPRIFWNPVLESFRHPDSDKVRRFLFALAEDPFIKRWAFPSVCKAIAAHASIKRTESAREWCLNQVRNAEWVHPEIQEGLRSLPRIETQRAFIRALEEGRCSPDLEVFIEIGEAAVTPLMNVLYDRTGRYTWRKQKACESLLKIDAGLFDRIIDCYDFADSQTRIEILTGLTNLKKQIANRRGTCLP